MTGRVPAEHRKLHKCLEHEDGVIVMDETNGKNLHPKTHVGRDSTWRSNSPSQERLQIQLQYKKR
jgi:hypothetical protein